MGNILNRHWELAVVLVLILLLALEDEIDTISRLVPYGRQW